MDDLHRHFDVDALQQQIIAVMDDIKREYVMLQGSFSSFVMLNRQRNELECDELASIKYKYEEALLIRNQQDRLFHKSNRHLLNTKADSQVSLNKLIRPSHFSRESLASLDTIPNKQTLKIITPGLTSAWDGSEYKRSLAVSLVQKLSIKLCFLALKFNTQRVNRVSTAVDAYHRVISRRLLLLCFLSLRFESLTTRFRTQRSFSITKSHLTALKTQPGFAQWRGFVQLAHKRHQQSEQYNLAARHHHLTQHKKWFAWLRLHTKQISHKRRMSQWSYQQRYRRIQLKALLVWKAMFITRHAVKVSLDARLQLGRTESFRVIGSRGRHSYRHPGELELTEMLAQLFKMITTALRHDTTQAIGLLQEEGFPSEIRREDNKNRHLLSSTGVSYRTESELDRYFTRTIRAMMLFPRGFASSEVEGPHGDRLVPVDATETSIDTKNSSSHMGSININTTVNENDNVTSSRVDDWQSLIGVDTLAIDSDSDEDLPAASGGNNSPNLGVSHTATNQSPSKTSQSQSPSPSPSSPSSQQLVDRALSLTLQMCSPVPTTRTTEQLPPNTNYNTSANEGIQTTGSRLFNASAVFEYQVTAHMLDSLSLSFATWRHHANLSKCARLVAWRSAMIRKYLTWRVWRFHYKKAIQRNLLCWNIHIMFSKKKVFERWLRYHRSYHRLAIAQVRVNAARNRMASVWKCMLQALIAKAQERRAIAFGYRRVMRLCLRFFRCLKRLRVLNIRSRLVQHRHEFHFLRQMVWIQWRTKLARRRLLRRCFAISDLAQRYFDSLDPLRQSTYSAVSLLFTGWKELYLEKKDQQRQAANYEKALLFRGQALLATHFCHWLIFHRKIRCHKQQQIRKTAMLFRAAYLGWACWYMELRTRRNTILAHCQQRYLSNLFLAWRQVVTKQVRDIAAMIRRWRCKHSMTAMRLLVRYYAVKRDLAERYRLKKLGKVFHEAWGRLFARRISQKLGVQRLGALYWKMKLRRILADWPGRAQWLLAESVRQNRLANASTKINIVDVAVDVPEGNTEDTNKENRHHGNSGAMSKGGQQDDDSDDFDDVEESLLDDHHNFRDRVAMLGRLSRHREHLIRRRACRSFIEVASISLPEQACKLGYIGFPAADKTGVTYIKKLMALVMHQWSAASKQQNRFRYLSRVVKLLHRETVLQNSLGQWMKCSRVASHRVLTWIQRKRHRAHSDYEIARYQKALVKDRRLDYKTFKEQKLSDLLFEKGHL